MTIAGRTKKTERKRKFFEKMTTYNDFSRTATNDYIKLISEQFVDIFLREKVLKKTV
jgi:hypothetical protein